MFGTQRTKQGGSVATFVITGLIMAVLLLGGLYLVNYRGQQARKSQEIATSETKKSKPSQEANDSSSTKSNTNTSSLQQPSGDVNEQNTAADTGTGSTPLGDEVSSTPMPMTGFELDIVKLIGIFTMTVAVAAYMASRRRQSSFPL